jgi:RNA processing factor Prp31
MRKIFVTSDSDANFAYRFKLKGFQKFDSAATAVEEAAAIIEGKVTPRLASLLDNVKDEKKVSLAVADPKLGMSSSISFQSTFN